MSMTRKQIAVFMELHSDMPRQGPGSAESTRRAFSLLEGLPDRPRILDVGCGPGAQTFDLARISKAEIVAVDNHPPYVEALAKTAAAEGLDDRISARTGDMFALDFPERSFDVVWAEGSIYIIGFERGLREWAPLLKTGGYVAVTEMTWLDRDAPQELTDFWLEAYPAMQDAKGNLAILERCGYEPVGHFPLPPETFWDDYYTPLEARLEELRPKYADDGEARQVLEMTEQEIDLHRRYAEYYGYVFYAGRSNVTANPRG